MEKRAFLVVLAVVVLCSTAYARQEYNPDANRWEEVPDNWVRAYDPVSGMWSYQPPGSGYYNYSNIQVAHDPYTGRRYYQPAISQPGYDPYGQNSQDPYRQKEESEYPPR